MLATQRKIDAPYLERVVREKDSNIEEKRLQTLSKKMWNTVPICVDGWSFFCLLVTLLLAAHPVCFE